MRAAYPIALAVVHAAMPAHAAPPFDTVSIVVGFSPGGGTDTYARLLARFLPRYLEGEPKVVVQNMPGSGSLKAVQSLATGAPKGSAVIVTFNYGLITDSQINPDRIRLRLTDYHWLGSLASVPAVCFAWHAAGVRNWDDLKARKEFNVGAPAVGSSNHINAMLMKNVLHAPVKAVTGYPGSADEKVAIERGELDGGCGGWSSVPAEWISQGKIIPLVSFSATPVDGLPRATPFAGDLARTEKDKQLISMMIGPSAVGRPFIVAKQTSTIDVAILRAAFQNASVDPEFLTEARRMSLPINVISGADAEKIVSGIYATPDDVVAGARSIVQ